MNESRIERERTLLAKIKERDQRIPTLENRLRKVLYVGYFTGAVVAFVCALFLF